jgi:hypothetical protein
VKSVLDIVQDNWIQVPIYQNKRIKKRPMFNSWGGSYDSPRYEIDSLPPRLLWLCLDWKLADVHKFVATKYISIADDLYDDGNQESKYERLFGMPLPHEREQGIPEEEQPTVREDLLDPATTSVPFVINVVNH